MQKSTEFNIDINSKDHCKRTGLHRACENGYSKIVEYLILKSDEFNIDINAENICKSTPFHKACEYGQLRIIEMFI